MSKGNFYISFRPDLSQSRPYAAVECGAGMLHRYLSGLRGFATLDEALSWSRKFQKESGFVLVSGDALPDWFARCVTDTSDAVVLDGKLGVS